VNLVLDASVTLAWFFQDERSDFSEELLDYVVDHGVQVPSIWPLEVANGLLTGYRRKRLAHADLLSGIESLATLPVRVDAPDCGLVLAKTVSLADRRNLTTYDAAYLELAMRLGVPLATNDAKLLRAAKLEKNQVVHRVQDLPQP